MLRDIREPEPVRGIGAEHALHVVVEHGRAGLLALPASPTLRGREDPGLRAQFPRRPPAHPPARPPGLVSEVPVAERRVVVVRVMQGVDPVRTEHVGVADGVASPPVVGLSCELQDPTRHRHGDPRFGELSNERVHHFGEPPSFRFACDRYAAALFRRRFG